MQYEYGKKFHGYEKYTHDVENILNNYCKKNGYEFSISENYGRELCYSILDKYSVITWINYNYGWNKWLFYNFEFHVDIDDIEGIKKPVLNFSITKVNFVYLLV